MGGEGLVLTSMKRDDNGVISQHKLPQEQDFFAGVSGFGTWAYYEWSFIIVRRRLDGRRIGH